LRLNRWEKQIVGAFPVFVCALLLVYGLGQVFVDLRSFYEKMLLDSIVTQSSRLAHGLALRPMESGIFTTCTNGSTAPLVESKLVKEQSKKAAEIWIKSLARVPLPGEIFFVPFEGKVVRIVCQSPSGVRAFAASADFFLKVTGVAQEGNFLANSSGKLILQPPGDSKLNQQVFKEAMLHYSKSGMKEGTTTVLLPDYKWSGMVAYREVAGTNLVVVESISRKKMNDSLFNHFRLSLFWTAIGFLLFVGVWSILFFRVLKDQAAARVAGA
jgi:hypothetical protein